MSQISHWFEPAKSGRLLIWLACLACLDANFPVLAQAAQRNPATQQALMEQLKEAQNALDSLSPEQKKMMRDMGIPLSVDALPPMPAGQGIGLATNEIIRPNKDAVRIARISGAPLSQATLPAFVRDAQGLVSKRIQPKSAELGEKLYRYLHAQGKSVAEMGKAAVGLWVYGRVETALYLMAKVCLDAPADTDNLNNFSAMLSMGGAEQLAIPLLHYLDNQFPNNATVLNNLGQAWYGLGDLDKAEPYLKAAVRRNAYHPQANLTQSFIDETKGNKTDAVESMKRAIKISFSLDKRNRLRKLGYTLQAEDVSLPLSRKPDSDPMGLNDFTAPRIPKTAEEESVSANDWRAFGSEIQARLGALAKQHHELTAAARQTLIQQGKDAIEGRPVLLKPNDKPPYYEQAVLKLKGMERDNGVSYRHDNARKALEGYARTFPATREAYWRERNQVDHRAALQTGEGQANADLCAERQAVITKYLTAYNVEYEKRLNAYLKATRLKLNEELFWLQFKETPERFQVTLLDYQIAWLSALSKAGQHFSTEDAEACTPHSPAGGGKLADFNDVHCDYHSELNFAGMGVIKTDCNKMTSTLGISFLKLGLTQDMDKETFADQFISCNVEVSAGVDRSVHAGPVEVGVQAGGSLGVEIGRTGIQDVYVTGGVGASISAVTPGLEMGATTRVSLVSGATTVAGSGLLGN